MLKKLLLGSFCILATVVVLNSQAVACTCGTRPTVLDAFENSNLVVVLKLVSVDKIREKEREYDVGYIRSVSMVVEKVYKGDVKVGAELKLAQGGGADCIWTYDEKWVGTKFLFYLGKPSVEGAFGEGMNSGTRFPREGGPLTQPMYHAIGCGRSTGLKGATDDLSYLDNLPKVRDKTRLSGTLDTWYNYDFKAGDISIKLVGKNKTFTTKTDKNGFFEIYDLPPGDYIAEVAIPFGWKINGYMLERTSTGFEEWDPAAAPRSANRIPVRIAPGRHAALDLNFDIDTAIKGKVLSPAGNPMKGVCVMAVSIELKEGDHRGASDCTNDRGEFLLDEMGPGKYRILANYDGKMDGDEPFGVIFHPGVPDRSKASIVSVEAGRHVVGQTIRIPETVELVSFNGRFLFSDGKPVADEWIKFTPDDDKRFDSMSIKTDIEGRFEFRVPKGAKGKIFGEMYTYEGEFADCRILEEMIKSTGRRFTTMRSNVASIDPNSPSHSIEISFPFPYCAKAKTDQ